jgi:hypothetical protein
VAEWGEAAAVYVDEVSEMIAVLVVADLAPLFPDFGLALDCTVVRQGEAQVRMWA